MLHASPATAPSRPQTSPVTACPIPLRPDQLWPPLPGAATFKDKRGQFVIAARSFVSSNGFPPHPATLVNQVVKAVRRGNPLIAMDGAALESDAADAARLAPLPTTAMPQWDDDGIAGAVQDTEAGTGANDDGRNDWVHVSPVVIDLT